LLLFLFTCNYGATVYSWELANRLMEAVFHARTPHDLYRAFGFLYGSEF
jgi:hypothetical protein